MKLSCRVLGGQRSVAMALEQHRKWTAVTSSAAATEVGVLLRKPGQEVRCPSSVDGDQPRTPPPRRPLTRRPRKDPSSCVA